MAGGRGRGRGRVAAAAAAALVAGVLLSRPPALVPAGPGQLWRPTTSSRCCARTSLAAAGRSGAGWPELFSWVNGTGMDTSDFAIEVAPVDIAPGELGLIAKSKMEPGDILAWAPTSLLLNRQKAVDVWGDSVEELADRVLITLFLIHERYVKGEESAWSVYMDSLPNFDGDVSGPTFLWSPEEWEWLEGSDGYAASVQMHDTLADEYETLRLSLFKDHPVEFPEDVYTWQRYEWAAACVASRAYGDDADGTNLAIAPLVDFLNHRAGALQLTRFGNGIVAYAHKHYDPGEQVWVSYGGKSNAQLLTQYGFVDEDNQEEAVFLRIGAHLEFASPHEEAKQRLLEELLGREPSGAILKLARRPREWEAELLPAARALALGKEDFVPQTVRELVPMQTPRLEAAAWGLLEEALNRRLGEYPASLEEDRKLLSKEAFPAGSLTERQTLGLRLRISEQEHLILTRDVISERHQVALAELAELTTP